MGAATKMSTYNKTDLYRIAFHPRAFRLMTIYPSIELSTIIPIPLTPQNLQLKPLKPKDGQRSKPSIREALKPLPRSWMIVTGIGIVVVPEVFAVVVVVVVLVAAAVVAAAAVVVVVVVVVVVAGVVVVVVVSSSGSSSGSKSSSNSSSGAMAVAVAVTVAVAAGVVVK